MHVRSATVSGLAVFTTLALASSLVYAAPVDAPAPAADIFDAKQRKVALGVSMPDGRNLSELDDFRASIGGRRVATWTIWRNWGNPGFRSFPMKAAKGARARGAVPMIWWEPINPSDWSDTTYTRNQNIIDGLHDDYISEFAREAKRFGTRVLLRFAHQANSDYLPWAWDYSKTDDNTRRTFIAAWRHVRRIFRDVGANNVKFVWTVATQTCSGDCLKRPLGYPGDKWVDYMGFTWENWGKADADSVVPSEPWTSMLAGFKPITRRLSAVSRKPIIAAAIASGPDGGKKAKWIRRGYRAVYKNLPRIKAIMYLNVDLSGPPAYHRDWSLNRWQLRSYAAIAALPEFRGRIR
ncbi:MAG: glycosyl hydrolase [Chloroflexota bacterium]